MDDEGGDIDLLKSEELSYSPFFKQQAVAYSIVLISYVITVVCNSGCFRGRLQ